MARSILTWDEYRVTFRGDNDSRLLWWDTNEFDDALKALQRVQLEPNWPDPRIEHRTVTVTAWEVVE